MKCRFVSVMIQGITIERRLPKKWKWIRDVTTEKDVQHSGNVPR